jgi:hypothetical protein
VERARRAAQLARSTAWMDTALAESVGEALGRRVNQPGKPGWLPTDPDVRD